MEYEIVLLYDGNKLTVAKVRIVRIEPVAFTDITKHWKRNLIVEEAINRVRSSLGLLEP